MIRIAIVVGTTRPGRRGAAVAQWVQQRATASAPADVEYALVDLAEFDLPVLDEPVPAALGEYRNPHTRRWSETVAGFDGFVFVTPEYNHSVPAALKNAIDYLFTEWHDKAAGFVSYGINGGIRAVEHLRVTLAEVKVAGVRSQVALQLFDDFEITDPREPGTFRPGARHEAILGRLLGEVGSWARALQPLREPATV